MLKALVFTCLFALTGLTAAAMPTDEMFDKLKKAPSESEANDIAQDIWASWLESGSATIDMIMARGTEAQNAGDYDTARAFYDRAILIKPDYCEAWHRRAGLFAREENFPEALRDLNEALRLEPRHFGAWASLASLFEAMSAEDQALDAWREVLTIYPTMREAQAAEKRLTKQAEGQGL
ncbi:MAG: tetratricopeptide repeat protein [Hyphomonas sp.]|uniref:tetratricopeptide repeat protein n=1 Tax=Hyphomonas sp. TaxID=87 RepID=UPI003529A25C